MEVVNQVRAQGTPALVQKGAYGSRGRVHSSRGFGGCQPLPVHPIQRLALARGQLGKGLKHPVGASAKVELAFEVHDLAGSRTPLLMASLAAADVAAAVS